MKIGVYREIFSTKSLYLVELIWVEFPFESILQRNLGSLFRLEEPGIQWGLNHSGRNLKNRHRWESPQPISFDHPEGKEITITGLILYSSLTELIDFIRERINRNHSGPLSALVRRASNREGKLDTAVLENRLEDSCVIERCYSEANLPVIKIPSMQEFELVHIEKGNEIWWAWELNPDSNKALLKADAFREVNGHQIPYFQFIKPIRPINSPTDEISDLNFMVFDGSKHFFINSLEDLHPEMLEMMDEKGYMYYQADFDLMPMEHLKAKAVLKVPPRAELQNLIPKISDCIKPDSTPHPRLKNPALIFDSHYPIIIDSDIPVIDNAEAVFWTLSRTVRGIFIPEQKGRMFPIKNIPEQESYLILAQPKRI